MKGWREAGDELELGAVVVLEGDAGFDHCGCDDELKEISLGILHCLKIANPIVSLIVYSRVKMGPKPANLS